MAAVLNIRGYEREAVISLYSFVNEFAHKNGLTKSLTLTLDYFVNDRKLNSFNVELKKASYFFNITYAQSRYQTYFNL